MNTRLVTALESPGGLNISQASLSPVLGERGGSSHLPTSLPQHLGEARVAPQAGELPSSVQTPTHTRVLRGDLARSPWNAPLHTNALHSPSYAKCRC